MQTQQTSKFREQPILNSPYECPQQHWELNVDGMPTEKIIPHRRPADFVTPIPKPKKYGKDAQTEGTQDNLVLFTKKAYTTAQEVSSKDQKYHIALINEIRQYIAEWRKLPASKWKVTPTTTRLLTHWRNHNFSGIRPFFCQIEAVETAIWLVEVAPKIKKYSYILDWLDKANEEANPGLSRIALKLATGAGKTTVMAMLIVWQTLNAVRSPRSPNFTKCFLVVTPGITIKDRLRVLQPNDPDSYYQSRELVPQDMLQDLQQARIVITNFHALKKREKVDLSKGTRAVLEGWQGEQMQTLENDGAMLHRVLAGIWPLKKKILVFNDEAHHCYRTNADASVNLSKEEEKNNETAHVWISGLEILQQQIGILKIFDLSATPFFLAGSGYVEGSIFPWTMSDFSLMDALESGIVKLPRVPVVANIPGQDVPMSRNLWEHIKQDMPRKKNGEHLDPLALPLPLQTALEALYGHYAQTFDVWQKEQMPVPPCFIIVCNNTVTSKLIYDFISGFYRTNADKTTQFVNGRYELLRNFDANGEPYARPRTLLIDSQQLDREDSLDAGFAQAAKDEIDRYKRDIANRQDSALLQQMKNGNLPDAVLLREVMNTVGKSGRLGESIRCVVSVSMLTEGWDANTVTHILGVRAFGTQLLCEQVVGRALRRYSYELNDKGLFNVEYADVLGVPFNFADKEVEPVIKKPRESIHVQAVSPGRDVCEIIFPRVAGYRVELPLEKLSASFNADSKFILTPDISGETEIENTGIIGESADLNLQHLQSVRNNTVKMHLTKHLLNKFKKFKDGCGEPKLYLFGQLKKIVSDWFDKYLSCIGGTYPAQLLFLPLANRACEKIVAAINIAHQDTHPINVVLDPYNSKGSTRDVNFQTSEMCRYRTDPHKSHLNWHICDSAWELEFCRIAEKHPQVRAYVKNRALGFSVPYRFKGESHSYIPDFLLLVDDGHGEDDLLHVVVEVKGYRNDAAAEKKATMETYWIPGVNRRKDFGRWTFVELKEVYKMDADLTEEISNSFQTMLKNIA